MINAAHLLAVALVVIAATAAPQAPYRRPVMHTPEDGGALSTVVAGQGYSWFEQLDTTHGPRFARSHPWLHDLLKLVLFVGVTAGVVNLIRMQCLTSRVPV
jgi:hypothetical protein